MIPSKASYMLLVIYLPLVQSHVAAVPPSCESKDGFPAYRTLFTENIEGINIADSFLKMCTRLG